jgi:hypothetical protein
VGISLASALHLGLNPAEITRQNIVQIRRDGRIIIEVTNPYKIGPMTSLPTTLSLVYERRCNLVRRSFDGINT